MGNAYASLGLRSPDRVPVLCLLRFVTPPHRAAAGGPPEAEDGRADRDELWEVKHQCTQCIYCNPADHQATG